MTESYDPPFIVTGVVVSLSGGMLYGLTTFLQRLMQRHNGVTNREADLGKKVVEDKRSITLPEA